MDLRSWWSGHVVAALKELLMMSEGKDPKPVCWRCEAGSIRTADGFHLKRRGVYAKCLNAVSAEAGRK